MAATALRENVRTIEDRSRTHGNHVPVARSRGTRTGTAPQRTTSTPRNITSPEDEQEEHLVAARRRVRRAHRSGVPRLAAFASVVIIAQLLALMYVKGLAMSATHAATDLDKRIAETTEEIKQAQRKISATTSTVQLEQWSRQLGLRRVQQNDIDRVSETARPADVQVPTEAVR
ncbi:MAG TPA: hypothetical protein VF681_09890 [Abditibacteriaceae bacterium]|jgi:cell division protein FtsL